MKTIAITFAAVITAMTLYFGVLSNITESVKIEEVTIQDLDGNYMFAACVGYNGEKYRSAGLCDTWFIQGESYFRDKTIVLTTTYTYGITKRRAAIKQN